MTKNSILIPLSMLMLGACTSGEIAPNAAITVLSQPLPYQHKLQSRDMADVDTIVIHCTELPTMKLSREYGERIHYASGTGNSGHYYVDKAGRLYQYVSDDKIAHHTRGYNERSIGIEMVNNGRYPHWFHVDSQQLSDPYPSNQVDSMINLVNQLKAQYPNIQFIGGHQDLDSSMMAAENDRRIQIRRKVDPGPLFPWPRVVEQTGLIRKFNESK